MALFAPTLGPGPPVRGSSLVKYSEIAASNKSKGVTIFLLTLVYPNG